MPLLQTTISCLALAGCTLTAVFFLVHALGLLLLRRPPRQKARPTFSVIVPAHNEESVLQETLQALARQDYTGLFEVIVVDDRSTDSTAAIVRDFATRDSRFHLVQISPSEATAKAPKKRALARGFAAARYELLASTDADCHPPRTWLTALSSCFAPGVGIVQGPKTLSHVKTLCQHYQQCETLALVGIEAGGFGLGRPLLASAPSLAYRHGLFDAAGGFSGLEDLESGDDDMLVQRMSRLPGVKVAYCPGTRACVSTPAASTWRETLNQRARWASNGTAYENKLYVALLCIIFLSWIFLLFGWLPALFGLVSGKVWLSCWALKFFHDIVYYTLAAWRLRRWSCLPWYPVFVIPQLAIGIWAAIAGHFGWYHWNARPAVKHRRKKRQ